MISVPFRGPWAHGADDTATAALFALVSHQLEMTRSSLLPAALAAAAAAPAQSDSPTPCDRSSCQSPGGFRLIGHLRGHRLLLLGVFEPRASVFEPKLLPFLFIFLKIYNIF